MRTAKFGTSKVIPMFLLLSVLQAAVVVVVAFSSQQQQTRRQFATTTTRTTTTKATTSLSMAATTTTTTAAGILPEGIAKTVVRSGGNSAAPIGRGDVVTAKYTCYAVSDDDDDDEKSGGVLLARAESQKMVVGDGSMVPGWDAALRTMTPGERSVVRIVDPSLGFDDRASAVLEAAALGGGGGSKDQERRQLEFDIEVLAVQSAAARAADLFDTEFDAMALADTTPKTAAEIAEAYKVRMENKAPEKEGLEGWIETVRNYYFFGFFEGETGEEAPWYLRPSITFPLAFAVVGAAFWVSLASGAISEKGAQSVDELDVRILAPALVSLMTTTNTIASGL